MKTGVLHQTLAKLWLELEPSLLVLLSLTLQLILTLIANQRKHTNNAVIRVIIWSTYLAADPVSTFALGVISTNLRDALKVSGSLDPSIELATFWAPFLLLHLGGADTITALDLQDNEMWLRHFSHLIVETVLASYVVLRVMKRSRLSILSAMMLAAGAIKYAERTWSLWTASYRRRRSLAQNVQSHDKRLPQHQRPEELLASLFKTKNDEELRASPSKIKNIEELLASPTNIKNCEEFLATKMSQNTEHMFADALLQYDKKNSSCKVIVQKASSSVVSKLIEMELELMYENLYTKAKVTNWWLGFAFRFISFLLILITLILFSFSTLHHRYNYPPFQLSVTFLLFMVAMLLEAYAAFVFLTSCRTISWLREHGQNKASLAMKSLKSLRSRRWSNSMGQYSLIRRSLGQKPMMRPFYEYMEQGINSFMKKDEALLYVYDRRVKDYVKEGIYQYLKQAEEMYRSETNKLSTEVNYSILNSKGRVPLNKWSRLRVQKNPSVDDPVHDLGTLLKYDMEFGEMVIVWHIVTEVCYYHDYDSLIPWKDEDSPPNVYRDWKISKYLSRYLMQLYVVSSGMLPPRGPLSEQKFYDEWESFFNPTNSTGETSNLHDQREKPPWRRRARVETCQEFWDRMGGRNKEKNPEEFWDRKKGGRQMKQNPLDAALGFLKVLLNDVCPPASPSRVNDDGHPQEKTKCDLDWQLLKEVWIELLVCAANQCRSKHHGHHLRKGGEFLTHVWVLVGHFGLFDHPFW